MPTTTINGHDVTVDDEGFMTVYDEWDEDTGKALAEAIGVDMTDEHWQVIRFLRNDFKDQGATPFGVVIGLDRCERGAGEVSAVEEVEQSMGLKVASVITMHDIIDWLAGQTEMSDSLNQMRDYREEYGV